jgi:hypothetical protein
MNYLYTLKKSVTAESIICKLVPHKISKYGRDQVNCIAIDGPKPAGYWTLQIDPQFEGTSVGRSSSVGVFAGYHGKDPVLPIGKHSTEYFFP